MKQKMLSLLTIAILGLAALGGRTGAGTAARDTNNGWELGEAIRYENITIFPVLSSESAPTSEFATLDEALASGEATISEQGSAGLRRTRAGQAVRIPEIEGGGASVNRLVLVNRGKRPLVLLAGELVSGGKQDRIIAKDRIVAPGEKPLPLDVFCVEHGRWSAGTEFASAKVMVHPSVRERAAVDQQQTEVWDAVRAGSTSGARAESVIVEAAPPLSSRSIQSAMAARAPTESYAKLYNSPATGVPIETFVEEVQKRFERSTANLKGQRVVGVVVAYGAEVAWSDSFASAELFAHYWNKLLRSYAIEALARPRSTEQADVQDARDFLRPLQGRETTESQPGVYRWREIQSGHYAEIRLEALEPSHLTLHRMMIHRTS
ncbi:MAG TPA: DUF6569 family protein [Candidatus Dormibacteraeota bacterium]|nr:DUF6569 family protein [Candidatus Dormibacteraeota bacterium]